MENWFIYVLEKTRPFRVNETFLKLLRRNLKFILSFILLTREDTCIQKSKIRIISLFPYRTYWMKYPTHWLVHKAKTFWSFQLNHWFSQKLKPLLNEMKMEIFRYYWSDLSSRFLLVQYSRHEEVLQTLFNQLEWATRSKDITSHNCTTSPHYF